MSKIIFKLSYRNPSAKDTVGANKAHIDYIGKRPGVDKSILTINEETIGADNAIYTKYINERPNSSGLFDKNGNADAEQYKAKMEKAQVVYRAVVSLRREDAEALGMHSGLDFHAFAKRVIPTILKNMGLPENGAEWCGAFHDVGHHPHIHLMFYEPTPKYKLQPQVSKDQLNAVRIELIKDIFSEEYKTLLERHNKLRNESMEAFKETISLATEEFNYKAIKAGFEKLSVVLKGKQGRMAYAYLPETTKQIIDGIVDEIMDTSKVRNLKDEYIQVLRDMSGMYQDLDEDDKEVYEATVNDLRRRFANIVLNSAKAFTEFKKEQFAANIEGMQDAITDVEKAILAFAPSEALIRDVHASMYRTLRQTLEGVIPGMELENRVIEQINKTFGTQYQAGDFIIPKDEASMKRPDIIGAMKTLNYSTQEIIQAVEKTEAIEAEIKAPNSPFIVNGDYTDIPKKLLRYKELTVLDDILVSGARDGIDLTKAYKKVESILEESEKSIITMMEYDNVFLKLEAGETIESLQRKNEFTSNLINELKKKGLVTDEGMTKAGTMVVNEFTRKNYGLTKDEMTLIAQSVPENGKLPIDEALSKITVKPLQEQFKIKIERLKEQGLLNKNNNQICDNVLFACKYTQSDKIHLLIQRIEYLERLGLVTIKEGKLQSGDNLEYYLKQKTEPILNQTNIKQSTDPEIQKLVEWLDDHNGYTPYEYLKFREANRLEYQIEKADSINFNGAAKGSKLHKAFHTYAIMLRVTGDNMEEAIDKVKQMMSKCDPALCIQSLEEYMGKLYEKNPPPTISKKDYENLNQVLGIKDYTPYRELYHFPVNKGYYIGNCMNTLIATLSRWSKSREYEAMKDKWKFLKAMQHPGREKAEAFSIYDRHNSLGF